MKRTFLFLLLCFSLSAEKKLPSWVHFEKAGMEFSKGNFQDALTFYMDALSSGRPYPEAEYMIGRIYKEEGEAALAEKQFLKALELAPFLQVPEDEYEIRYALAEVYLISEQWEKYSELLTAMLTSHIEMEKEIRIQNAYIRVLTESGLNKLLILYRKERDSVLEARKQLGLFQYKQGKYSPALLNLTTSALAVLSRGIEEVMKKEPGYELESVDNFLKKIKRNKRVSNYFNEMELWKILYYTGLSLYGEGHEERAAEIWTLIQDNGEPGIWQKRAQKQLKKPELEKWQLIY